MDPLFFEAHRVLNSEAGLYCNANMCQGFWYTNFKIALTNSSCRLNQPNSPPFSFNSPSRNPVIFIKAQLGNQFEHSTLI